MFRTRFKKSIVAEFLPPAKKSKKERVIILCDGMPSVPRKQPLAEFLSTKGFWVFYPRYRGAWESDGIFLQRSPHLDILDIIYELDTKREVVENAFLQKFRLIPDEFYIIGGSFGGAVAIISSLDSRIKKVIANCPVVDWSILADEPNKETSNKSYVSYIREAFGNGYRLPEKNWQKLFTGKFFNPANYISQLDPKKILIFHTKDDPYIPSKLVKEFARRVGLELITLNKGGHIRTELVVVNYWDRISKFFRY